MSMFILNHQESDGAILIFFSFHNQLKTVQLNGKVNRRVDFLLHQLLNYEKDAYFNYKRNHQLPPAINRKSKEDLSRHDRGLLIPIQDVQVCQLCKLCNF